jgi:trehalose 6-phosphate synthase/phosphatase
MPPSQSAPYRFKRLVLVSYRLPYKVEETKGGGSRIIQNSGGLVSAISTLSSRASTDASEELYKKVVWVGKEDAVNRKKPAEGTLARFFRHISSAAGQADLSAQDPGRLRDRFQIVPVTIDKALDEKYYGGFSNDCVWPLFHYFPSLVSHDESYFESYAEANRLFAEKVKSVLQPDDFVWVHDYQLFLLPGMLRAAFPSANIGFFLHIPFPAFEVFRILPHRWRDAILKGMLGADLIGFHTFDYSQYFLRTVSRLLGYETTMNSVSADDRVVRVDAFPLGIDFEKFNAAATGSPEVDAEKSRILANLQDKKLVFSVDRLDYSKGLLLRLDAFEYFLEKYPQWVEKIVFNMVVVPSRDSILRYQEMKREIEAAVGRINGKHSTMAWRPIVYQYRSLSFSELVALYDVSLVGLITPIRDGMNLVAKEYVACQVTEKGVLILSEMAGAAAELNEALLINPTDKNEVADAIHKALSMPLRERTVLITRMQKRIRTYTVFTWAKDFAASLDAVKREQEMRKVNLLSAAQEPGILSRFKSAERRIIFLDYDGTLVPFSSVPELAVPGAQTLAKLKALADNPKNTVVLISGRDKAFLGEWFGATAVHLIAEHGAFQKAPGQDWQCAIDTDQNWKTVIAPILQRYTERCNGSFIEEKFSSLAWHFRNSPREMGLMKAKELKEELRTLVAHENKLQVMDGNMVVEVKRTGYDKGMAAQKFVSGRNADFVIAFGDDRTDEDIFRALPPDTITVKIGVTTSIAKYNLASQHDVARFLDRLIESDAAGTTQATGG